MHSIEYGYRYPAIRAITNLQQIRDQGAVSIAFDRVGYTQDDVLESRVYVYVGKCGEHTGWVSDDAPYGADIDASNKKYILYDALDEDVTNSPNFFPADERVIIPDNIKSVVGVTDPSTTTKYFGSDLQNASNGGSSLPSNSKYNGNNYYGKWRRVLKLGNKTVKAYFAYNREGGAFNYRLSAIDAYQLRREDDNGSQVFKNPTAFPASSAFDGKAVLKRFSKSLNWDGYYQYRFGKFGEQTPSTAAQHNGTTCVVELDLEDLFYLSGGEYQNQYQEEPTVNLDFNPHTLQPEISSKDKGKLMYNIFHGKTPIFFMITERLKESHYGLANFYFAQKNTGHKNVLCFVSSKKQVIADRLWNRGDIYKEVDVGHDIERIVVDLAQGSGYNPSFENNKRRVWVTTQDGWVRSYDYWTGDLKASAQASSRTIKSVAINPKDGSCVFVRVSGNAKNNFLQVCRMARDSSTVEVIANIPDYAQTTMVNFPMTGNRSEAGIARRLHGAVISRQSDSGKDSDKLWFTFIVNSENTISVQLEPGNNEERKILWVDRMHYGMWHGANFNGNYKVKGDKNGYKKHAPYYENKEYGVKANQENLKGIVTGIGGNVYVNGHTYLHFDNRNFRKYTIIGVLFKSQNWSHSGRDDLKSCGHYYGGHGYGDGNNPPDLYWSYDFDEDTGTWKTDNSGYAKLCKKHLNEMGWPAPDPNGNHYIFAVKDSNSGMTWDVLSKEIGPKLGKDTDGDHWCRMSWQASDFQTKKKTDIKNMKDIVGDFPPIKPNQSTGLVNPGVKFSQSKGTPTFGGSGYAVHMGSTKKSEDVSLGNKGHRPLNIGFLYNAEAYNLKDKNFDSLDKTKKYPVFLDGNGREDEGYNFFTAGTGLVEDAPLQKNGKARPDATRGVYNFYRPQDTSPPPIPTSQDGKIPGIFQIQHDAWRAASTFKNKFGYLEINDPKYIPKNIVPENNRTGFCEDAHGVEDHLKRWKDRGTGTPNGTGTNWDAFSAMSERIYDYDEPGKSIQERNTMFGLEECLPSNGQLQPTTADRYIYHVSHGLHDGIGTADGLVSAKCSNGGKVNADSPVGIDTTFDAADVDSISTVYLDDTNGLWCEKDGQIKLKTVKEKTGSEFKPYRFDPDGQITNLGHNKCSNPFFEYVAYAKNTTGVKYGYEQYVGAKDYAINRPIPTEFIVGGGVSDGTTAAVGVAGRLNDDPIGMRPLKALGYSWTKSTKVHPTSVMPSGRLYIIDHYVIEDNPCKFMDTIYLDPERTQTMDVSISSIPTSADFIDWSLKYKYSIYDSNEVEVHKAGYLITSGTYIECSAAKAIIPRTSAAFHGKKNGTTYAISASMDLTSSFDMSAATVKRPMHGLPRVSNSFWDYSTDEGIIIEGNSDEAAAIDAYEYLHMLNLPPMYLSDGSTIIGNPVAFRCAGYDKFYTAHLASIYDSGTYEIDKVSIWFNQNPDADYTKSKARYTAREYGPTELSSITIRDKEGTPTFGRDTIIARSNRHLSAVLDDSNVVYNHYRDTYCLSADTVWDSINAYGKPQGINALSAMMDLPEDKRDANLGGWPLSGLYGQTCPRQWYGTEVYRHSNYNSIDGNENRISLLHEMRVHGNSEDSKLPDYISGYGIHPAVYPDEARSSATVIEMSGAFVENAALGLNTAPHTVGGSFTTNYYAYVDEREAPSAVTVDMGKNYVYVFERWPTQYWYATCTDSRGGLSLFGDCPDFEEED